MISVEPDQANDRHIHGLAVVMSFKRLTVFTLAGILLFAACKGGADIQTEGLYGKWDIAKAVRNGKETPYLRGGYFIIEPNGTMTVNITGSEEKGPYTLRKNTLRINDEKDFIIEAQQQDSLSLRYIMNADNTFLIYLGRSKDETR
jgi:hypothetical protein